MSYWRRMKGVSRLAEVQKMSNPLQLYFEKSSWKPARQRTQPLYPATPKTGFTLLELILFSLILGIAFTLFLNSGITLRWELESRARNWKPSKSDLLQPPMALFVPSMDISGTWSRGLHSGSSLTIREQESGVYTVWLSTGGCLGHCSLKRKGSFSHGVLTLDRPLAEYDPGVHDRIYALRVGGNDCLLGSGDVKFLLKELKGVADGTSDGAHLAFVFERVAD